MQPEDRFTKLSRSIHHFMNRQWSKVRCSTAIERQLDEEYETLLREIDHLVPAKPCFFSYQNNNFNNRSSGDLTKMLKGHSREVLKTYIANHRDKSKLNPPCNRHNLINYVTEIIVSRPKCNHKVCKCGPRNVAKEFVTDTGSPSAPTTKNVNGTEVRNSGIGSSSAPPIKNMKNTEVRNSAGVDTASQKSNNLHQHGKVDAEVQTDHWNHDPDCTCGCCPKLSSQVIVKNAIEENKQLQDATTSDKQIPSKNVFPNCTGTQTSLTEENGKICVPDNFESLLSNSKNQFSTCSAKQDCGCDPYDVKEANKKGLILPSSDICVQKKVVIVEETKKSKRGKEYDMTTSNDGTASESSSLDKEKITKKNKKNENNQNKKRRSSSILNILRNKNNQKGETTTGCFGSRKKKKQCEEHCQGVSGRQRSIQTMPITHQDKGEEVHLYGEKNRKAAHTSTDSEIGTQMSARHSKQSITDKGIDNADNRMYKEAKKIDKETKKIDKEAKKIDKEAKKTDKEAKKTDREAKKIDKEARESDKETKEISSEARAINQSQESLVRKESNTKQENKEQPKEAIACDKCGRQKRDCNTACRNTIIVPYGSRSGAGMPAGEAESLRMLIKMQNKDTNRQLNNLITELRTQKSEIRRLNNMYQKMVENFYESNKSIDKNENKAETYECGCSDAAKLCGCSFDRECATKKSQKMVNNIPYSSDGKVTTNVANEKSQNKDGRKRFGPPNTAVAINICKPNSTGIGKNPADYFDAELRRRKDQFRSRNARFWDEGSGDFGSSSLSTIFISHKAQQIASFEDIPLNTQQTLEKIGDGDSPEKHSNKSSKVLVWLKKSWINLKGKKSECERKDQEQQEGSKVASNVLNFCQSAGRRAVGLWNAAKGKK